MLKRFLLVLSFVLFSFVPASSREITNGIVEVTQSFGFIGFGVNVAGKDFSVSVGGSNLARIAFAPCIDIVFPCTAGQVIELRAMSGQWDFSDMSGSMTIDGTPYSLVNQFLPKLPSLAGRGDLGFGGGSVMIPFNDAPTVTLKALSSMNGRISGRASDLPNGVGINLSGSGIGTIVLVRSNIQVNGQEVYLLRKLTYRFGIHAGVDIKPGDDLNQINLRSRGKTTVAILSTAAFDASEIDPLTVTVAGAPVILKPNGTPMSSLEDINADGLLDLVVHVSTAALQPNFDNECVVEGTTFNRQFVWGTDTIAVDQ